MKTAARLCLLIFVITLLIGPSIHAQDSAFPRTITDGGGNPVVVKAKPVRIASVTLSTDEIMLAMVEPSRLISVTSFALDPAVSNVMKEAEPIPNKIPKADPETILALKPDLVLVSTFLDAGVTKQLRDAGLTVFMIGNLGSIKDVKDSILLLGQVVGEEQRAAATVAEMDAKLNAVAEAVKGVKPQTAMYYGPEGYSDGPGSLVDDVITHAGGINAVTAGGIKEPYPNLNDEFIIKQDPDVILLAGYNSYAPGFVEGFRNNPNFKTLKAVKNNRVFVANDAHVAAASQYIVEGVVDVAMLLYPDAIKDRPIVTPAATLAATKDSAK
ncbi:MAG: ABC transporter substrate-binding protein [Anaerolineae bacterium]|nr:ABC transporter substrate-binding protein [Anaerolineae bacterium]